MAAFYPGLSLSAMERRRRLRAVGKRPHCGHSSIALAIRAHAGLHVALTRLGPLA